MAIVYKTILSVADKLSEWNQYPTPNCIVLLLV